MTERARATEAGLDERLQRRLADFVTTLVGEPLRHQIVARSEPEPAPRSRRRVALVSSLVLVVVLISLALLVQSLL